MHVSPTGYVRRLVTEVDHIVNRCVVNIKPLIRLCYRISLVRVNYFWDLFYTQCCSLNSLLSVIAKSETKISAKDLAWTLWKPSHRWLRQSWLCRIRCTWCLSPVCRPTGPAWVRPQPWSVRVQYIPAPMECTFPGDVCMRWERVGETHWPMKPARVENSEAFVEKHELYHDGNW